MKPFDNIVSGLNFPNKVLAVEYSFEPDSDMMYAALLYSKGGEVNLQKTLGATSLQDLVKTLDKGIPVLLVFTGKKVLSKQINHPKEAGQEELAARAFPSIDRNGLFFQVTSLEDGDFAVSAIRKDVALEVFESFRGSGMEVLDAGIGTYSNWPLFRRCAEGNTIVGKYNVQLDDKTVTEIEEPEVETLLFNQSLESNYTASFLFGLQALAGKSYQGEIEVLTKARQEWKFGLLYSKGLMGLATLFFIVLLVSFLLFNHYNSSNAELSALTQSYDKQFRELEKLKSSYSEKNEFLQINGSQNSHTAQMADQMAALLPDKVSLTEMNFQPVERKLKKENLVRFSRDELQIKGQTGDYDSFQSWLKALRELNWADDIEIMGYKETDSKHSADFSIKIKLGDG